MQKIELELDEQTVERARHLAEQRHTTLEEWLKSVIKQMVVAWTPTTSTNWEQEKEFIRQRMAKGPVGCKNFIRLDSSKKVGLSKFHKLACRNRMDITRSISDDLG